MISFSWNSLYCSLSPNESFSWKFLCPHPRAHLQVLGCIEIRPEDTRRKIADLMVLPQSFSLVCLLLFTSQVLQIAAPCILSKFNSCIQWKIQGGVCLLYLIQNQKYRYHNRSSILFAFYRQTRENITCKAVPSPSCPFSTFNKHSLWGEFEIIHLFISSEE